MKRKPRLKRRQAEPTIALINVVFLMLIFFLIAGTLAPPLDTELQLVSVDGLEGRPPPDALVIHADGRVQFRGEDIDLTTVDISVLTPTANAPPSSEGARVSLRIIPDKNTPAERLLEVATALRLAGATDIRIVTERGLQ
ncbi:ExbD/TolR family protein [Halocynthiibacter namhaensis]|uniref:ExbD/TolR family protein n=1 Tax=Halocynthiibacter namhaensis TaxID=1290553 RepID=UPI000578F902|nr:biopolymer transporter ExbD [Halocynthiibacter namhaensis]